LELKWLKSEGKALEPEKSNKKDGFLKAAFEDRQNFT
jgi:hypothetical protein